MRHFIFLGAMAGMLTLSGCTAGVISSVPDPDRCFTAQAEIQMGGEAVRGELSRTGEYSWKMTVTEPFALEGMVISADSEDTTLSMCGFESNADISDEAVSALRLIMEAYEGAVKGECTYSENTFSGTNENGSYQLIFTDGTPETLKISEKGVMVKLSEWEEVSGEEMVIDN